MSKVLVACFSATGVTLKVAKELAEVENADLFEIVPAEPYTAADLDYTNPKSRSCVEMNDPNCRPAVSSKVQDMGQYDVIFLGFPIWWNREPSVVDTFLEDYDFTGKTIVPFCTSGGSPIGFTGDRIKNLTGGKAAVTNGKRLGGTVSMEELKIWAEGL